MKIELIEYEGGRFQVFRYNSLLDCKEHLNSSSYRWDYSPSGVAHLLHSFPTEAIALEAM